MSVTTVVTPSRASVTAISRPMPRPAPVTIAAVPFRAMFIGETSSTAAGRPLSASSPDSHAAGLSPAMGEHLVAE
jgi:hypothetical protein